MSLQNSIGYPEYCVGYNGYIPYSGIRPQPGKVGYGEWRDTVSNTKYKRENPVDARKMSVYTSVYRKDMRHPPPDFEVRKMIAEGSKEDKTEVRRSQALRNGIPELKSVMQNDYRLPIPRTAPAGNGNKNDGSVTARGRLEGAKKAATGPSAFMRSLNPLLTPRDTKPATAIGAASPRQAGSRIFTGENLRSSNHIDFGEYKNNPVKTSRAMTAREYVTSTIDLGEGTPKDTSGHIPGYTGFLPISKMNKEAIAHAKAVNPRRAPFQKDCNLRGNYRHNIPGYGGFQPDAERNDHGPVQQTTRTQTGDNHRWNKEDAAKAYIKPKQKNPNKKSTTLTCSTGTNQRLLSQTGRLVAPGASTYDF